MFTTNIDPHNQPPALDVAAIVTHLHELTDVQSCPDCDAPIATVLADVSRLLITAGWLSEELASVRLDAANLRAAIRAALGAAGDGEADPLAYLRWELPDSEQPSQAEPAARRL